MSLESDTSVAQMAYVDEAECIGCTYPYPYPYPYP